MKKIRRNFFFNLFERSDVSQAFIFLFITQFYQWKVVVSINAFICIHKGFLQMQNTNS